MIDVYLIFLILSINYGINYILPVYYVGYCRHFLTFNSPICLCVLTAISSNAYLHYYIFYSVAIYLFTKFSLFLKRDIINNL